MKLANLVFDDEFEDTDILLVQDKFFDDELKNMSEFDHWTKIESNGCFKIINNKLICCVETEELIRWLNIKFGSTEKNQARIIKQHTKYDPKLPIIEL